MWLRVAALGLMLVSGSAKAVLTIEVLQRLEKATPVAVEAFSGPMPGGDLAEIIRDDMDFSGAFRSVDQAGLGAYAVQGRVTPRPDGQFTFDYALKDVSTGATLLGEQLTAGVGRWRDVGHYMSDRIYQQ